LLILIYNARMTEAGKKQPDNSTIPGWLYFIGAALLLLPCSVLGMTLFGMAAGPLISQLEGASQSCLANPMMVGGVLGYFIWALIVGNRRKAIVQSILYISIGFGFLTSGSYTHCGEPGIRVAGAGVSLLLAYLGFFTRSQGQAFLDSQGQDMEKTQWKKGAWEAVQYIRYAIGGVITFYLAFMLSYMVVMPFIRIPMDGDAPTSTWAMMTFAPLVGQFIWGVWYGLYVPFRYRLAVWVPLVLAYAYFAWEMRSSSYLSQFIAPALCAPAGLFLGFQWQRRLPKEAGSPKLPTIGDLNSYLPRLPITAGVSALLVVILVFGTIWGSYAQEHRNKDLLSAAARGQFEHVKALVEQGADINYKGYGHSAFMAGSTQTPLTSAIGSGSEKIALYLLEKGAKHDPNELLPSAAAAGEIEVLDYFLKEGTTREAKNKALVSASHDHRQIFYSMRGVETRLSPAGSISIIKRLLKEGAEINAQSNGMTPLMAATQTASLEVLDFLIDAGADANARSSGNSNYPGFTALMFATKAPYVSSISPKAEEAPVSKVKRLIQAGADIKAEDEYGFPVFIQAAKEGNIAVMQALLETGADINQVDHRRALQRTGYPYTSRHEYYADDHNRKERYFDEDYTKHRIKTLGLPPDTDIKLIDGPFGATALMWASTMHSMAQKQGYKGEKAGRKEEIEFLLQHGARINDRDKYGATALMWAAASGHDEERITQLLKAGADLNAKDKYGNNALMYPLIYSGYRQQAIIDTLLEAGIDYKNRNIAGNAAGDISALIETYFEEIKLEKEALKQQELNRQQEIAQKKADEAAKAFQRKQKCLVLTPENAQKDPFLSWLYNSLKTNWVQVSPSEQGTAVLSLKFKTEKDTSLRDGKTITFTNFGQGIELIPGKSPDTYYQMSMPLDYQPGVNFTRQQGIKESSGNPDFDKVCMDAANKIIRIPTLPDQYNGKCIEITFPISQSVKVQETVITTPHFNNGGIDEASRLAAMQQRIEARKQEIERRMAKVRSHNKASNSGQSQRMQVFNFPARGCKLISKQNATSDQATKLLYDVFRGQPIKMRAKKGEKSLMSVAFHLQKIRKQGDTSPRSKPKRNYTFEAPASGPSMGFVNYGNPDYQLSKVFGLNMSSGNLTLDEAAYNAVKELRALPNYPEANDGDCFDIPFPLE
jgi:ankyrin repeat protein